MTIRIWPLVAAGGEAARSKASPARMTRLVACRRLVGRQVIWLVVRRASFWKEQIIVVVFEGERGTSAYQRLAGAGCGIAPPRMFIMVSYAPRPSMQAGEVALEAGGRPAGMPALPGCGGTSTAQRKWRRLSTQSLIPLLSASGPC